MLPNFSEERREALSGIEIPSVLGGASPLPELSPQFSDDWRYHFFVVVPLAPIKHYNRDAVVNMIRRCFLLGAGEYDRDAFPPVLESWDNPVSVCVKLSCTRKVFNEIQIAVKSIYTDFGGDSELVTCYQTSGERL